jgi:hypothetical protein
MDGNAAPPGTRKSVRDRTHGQSRAPGVSAGGSRLLGCYAASRAAAAAAAASKRARLR